MLQLDKPDNLYAAPESNQASGDLTTSGPWRQNKLIITKVNGAFPPRCVRCNTPTPETLRQTFYWHHPLAYLTLLINVLVYIIVAYASRKASSHDLSVCPTHQRHRKRQLLLAWGGGPALLVLGLLLLARDLPIGWIPIAAWVPVMLVCGMRAQVLRATRIDKDFAHFKGADPGFLDSLPEWVG